MIVEFCVAAAAAVASGEATLAATAASIGAATLALAATAAPTGAAASADRSTLTSRSSSPPPISSASPPGSGGIVDIAARSGRPSAVSASSSDWRELLVVLGHGVSPPRSGPAGSVRLGGIAAASPSPCPIADVWSAVAIASPSSVWPIADVCVRGGAGLRALGEHVGGGGGVDRQRGVRVGRDARR